MNVWDILILAAVALMVYFAVRAIRGGKSCCKQGCAACEKNCACNKKQDS